MSDEWTYLEQMLFTLDNWDTPDGFAVRTPANGGNVYMISLLGSRDVELRFGKQETGFEAGKWWLEGDGFHWRHLDIRWFAKVEDLFEAAKGHLRAFDAALSLGFGT